MIASDKLINALKGFEGFQAKAYKCPAGVWTIGYGHTKGVKAGNTISKDDAEKLLRNDLAYYEAFVNSLGVCKTQGQFDALVDFVYNLGTNALKSSTLLRCIYTGASKEQICYQFMRWNKAGGKVLPGLTKRRTWEASRFYEQS